MGQRLDQLQSFIWWTTPLYAVLAALGLVETHFTLTLALATLFAVLAAFGLFDGFVLSSLRGLREEAIASPMDSASVRGRLDRLARTVLLGGTALGTAALAALALVWLGGV